MTEIIRGHFLSPHSHCRDFSWQLPIHYSDQPCIVLPQPSEMAILNLQSAWPMLQGSRDTGCMPCIWETWGGKGHTSLWGDSGWTKLGIQLVQGPVPAGTQYQQFHCHNVKCSCRTLNLCITVQTPVICLSSWWRSTLHCISATKKRCHLLQHQWKSRCCFKFNKWPSYRWVLNIFLQYSKGGYS